MRKYMGIVGTVLLASGAFGCGGRMETAYRNHLRAADAARERGTAAVVEQELGEAEDVARRAGRKDWIGAVAATRGEIRLEEGDYADALEKVAAVNAEGGTFHSWFIEGKASLAQNRVDRAAAAFARAESRAGNEADASVARDYSALCAGLIAYQGAQVDRAAEAFGRIRDAELAGIAGQLVRRR